MTVVKIEWGTKRLCQSCTARFYDLCRTPIICPKCGDAFEIQTPSRGRKSRTASAEEKLASVPLDILEDADIALPEDIDPELVSDDDLLAEAEDMAEDMDDIPASLNESEDH